MSAHLLYKPEFCQTAIEVMKEGYPIVNVAAALKVTKKTIHEWVQTYPEFADAIETGRVLGEAKMNELGRWGLGRKDFQYNVWAKILQRNYQDSWDRKVKVESVKPGMSYAEQIAALKGEAFNGNLTPKEAETLTNIVRTQAQVEQADEIERRLRALEEKNK